MKDDPNAFRNWLTTLFACCGIMITLLTGWSNLTNQLTTLKTEVQFISAQIIMLRTAVETHIALPTHPVAEERTKQLVKEMIDALDRIVKLEQRKP